MITLEHVTKLYGSVIGVNDVTVALGAGAHEHGVTKLARDAPSALARRSEHVVEADDV